MNSEGTVTYTYSSDNVNFNTQNPNQPSGSFPVGTSQVTVTGTDTANGQTAQCTFLVVVSGGKIFFLSYFKNCKAEGNFSLKKV